MGKVIKKETNGEKKKERNKERKQEGKREQEIILVTTCST